jgi:hypothetical protein
LVRYSIEENNSGFRMGNGQAGGDVGIVMMCSGIRRKYEKLFPL